MQHQQGGALRVGRDGQGPQRRQRVAGAGLRGRPGRRAGQTQPLGHVSDGQLPALGAGLLGDLIGDNYPSP